MTGMHIVIVPAWWPSPEQPISGVFCTDYARAFAAAGAKVGVIFPDMVSLRHLGRGNKIPWTPCLSHERLDEVAVIRIRGLHTALGRPGLQMRRYRRWLRRGLGVYRERHGQPDLLHAHCAIPAGWACTRLDDRLSRRVVLTEHTGSTLWATPPSRGGSFIRAALTDAATVVAVSEVSKTAMQSNGIDRPIEVVSNPVYRGFAGTPPPQVSPDEHGRPIFRAVFVGRLTEMKGIPELIDAALILSGDERFAVQWHIAGYGPAEEALRERFATAGQADSLKLHGFCAKEDTARLIGQAHFIILPSHDENCPLAICEALSAGRPVVTTEAEGCRALVGPDDGVLARIGDAASLAEATRRLILDYPQWDWQGISSRARSRFSAATVAARYADIFRRLQGALGE